MKRPFPALPLALFLLGVQSLHSQTPTPTPFQYTYEQAKTDLTRFIREQMDKENVKGLSIALVDGSQVIWQRGFGFANPDKNIPATEETRYALGGVSRVFTAAEVMRLVEKGRLDLDSSLTRYLPGFSIHSRFKKTKPITLRALLACHSGLPGFFVKGLWVDEPETLADLVEDLKSDYLYDPPQKRYRYSYTDYDLLGRVVELKRKKAFGLAAAKDLFEPLGMDASAFEAPVPDDATAQGFIGGKAIPPGHLRDVPAAGMVSSAKDLARFMGFLFGAEPPEGSAAPLKPGTLEKLITAPYPHQPQDFGHEVGMGWNLTGFPVGDEKKVVWCDGTFPGFFASMVILPREKLGVAVLSNTSEAGKIADDISTRALKLALQVKNSEPQNLEKKKVTMSKVVEVPRETLEGYQGIYSVLGQVAPIQLKEKNLGIEYQGHQLDLLPISQDTFVPHLTFLIFPIDLPQYPLTFDPDQGVAILGGLHFPVPLQRIESVEIPEEWSARMGDYVLENPDGQVDFERVGLEKKGDFLTVVMKLSMKALNLKNEEFKVAILPLSEEDAVVPGLFYGDGGTLHAVEEEGDTRIYYSGYWFKKKQVPQAVPEATPVKPAPKPVAPAKATASPQY